MNRITILDAAYNAYWMQHMPVLDPESTTHVSMNGSLIHITGIGHSLPTCRQSKYFFITPNSTKSKHFLSLEQPKWLLLIGTLACHN